MADASLSLAHRVADLQPESAYLILAKAQELERSGRDIIHLEIGEPDFATADHIVDAGVRAIREGRTRYNPTAGVVGLREAIVDDLRARRSLSVTPENIVVGPGAKPLLFLPTLALVQPGDEVIYPDPGFPTYRSMIRVAGATPVPIALSEENGFSFDLNRLRQRVNERTKLIVLNSPSNPTGGVINPSDLAEIAELAKQFDCWVLSDEIYARMCYDEGDAASIATIDGMLDRTVIVDGFSKTYAMTGWRLGFAVMPRILAEKVSLLMVHSAGCTAEFTQYAGMAALTESQQPVTEMMAKYRQRRDVLVEGLNQIPGVRCQLPAGAFYAFPNVGSFGRTSVEIADLLLEQAGVATVPGTAFGDQGEGFLRVCYANSLENIREGVARIRAALESIG